MARQLTVRGVPDDVVQRLEALSRERGQSMNATVNEILVAALGLDERASRLRRYAARDDSDLAAFRASLARQRRIDDELWR